jgi:hypothetical protein
MVQRYVFRSSTSTRIGYTRVSTVAQTLDQQNEALAAAGVMKVFSDVMSGARDDRPGLAALLEYVRAGDTVVVWKLDRLGRNMLHTLQTVEKLTDLGVTLVSVTDGIDSSTPAGRMMIGVLGWTLPENADPVGCLESSQVSAIPFEEPPRRSRPRRVQAELIAGRLLPLPALAALRIGRSDGWRR